MKHSRLAQATIGQGLAWCGLDVIGCEIMPPVTGSQTPVVKFREV